MTQASNSGTLPKDVPQGDLLPLDTVRNRLSTVWFAGAAAILGLMVLQSLLGKYGDKTQDAWSWALPTLMPILGMIVSVLGYSALDSQLSRYQVRKSFFRLALWLSLLYEALVLLTLLIQPVVGADPIALMHTSNLWLGPFQGVVASALGVLFVSTKPKENQEKLAAGATAS
jgi:hypothetical protein